MAERTLNLKKIGIKGNVSRGKFGIQVRTEKGYLSARHLSEKKLELYIDKGIECEAVVDIYTSEKTGKQYINILDIRNEKLAELIVFNPYSTLGTIDFDTLEPTDDLPF